MLGKTELVDRSNHVAAIKSIEYAGRLVENGVAFTGTRSTSCQGDEDRAARVRHDRASIAVEGPDVDGLVQEISEFLVAHVEG